MKVKTFLVVSLMAATLAACGGNNEIANIRATRAAATPKATQLAPTPPVSQVEPEQLSAALVPNLEALNALPLLQASIVAAQFTLFGASRFRRHLLIRLVAMALVTGAALITMFRSFDVASVIMFLLCGLLVVGTTLKTNRQAGGLL